MRKLISMSTFHLKGSGWYVTDYAGKNPGAAKPAENKTETAEKKTDSVPSTSSPAAKDS
jgi:predicted nucleic acid-binding Zn ribbon protein